jgi:nitrate reductase NapA
VKSRGLRWPVVQAADGAWKETTFRFMEFSDSFVEKGRGIQFYHSVTKDDKALIWFCAYEPPPSRPTATTRCGSAPAACWSTGTPAR